MDRAVAYFRVSTKQQHRSGLGIEAQRALDRLSVQRAVDEAVDLRIADERRLRPVRVDQAGLRILAKAIAIDTKLFGMRPQITLRRPRRLLHHFTELSG